MTAFRSSLVSESDAAGGGEVLDAAREALCVGAVSADEPVSLDSITDVRTGDLDSVAKGDDPCRRGIGISLMPVQLMLSITKYAAAVLHALCGGLDLLVSTVASIDKSAQAGFVDIDLHSRTRRLNSFL